MRMRNTMLAEMLSFPFFQRALMGGLLVAVMLSVLSFFIVLRRISFIGVGISHSALGGVAVGVALGLDTTLTTSIFCALVALLIGFISRRGHIREDAAIGITFSGTMALGVTLIALSGSYLSSLFSYLFGSILSITKTDIYVITVYCVSVVVLISAFFRQLLHASFNEEVARVTGINVGFLHYLLLVLVALAIVASIKLVGIVLVSALLVLPAATANLIGRTYGKVLAFSIISSTVALVVGLMLSYRFDLPSGATIVLCGCCIFFLCFAVSSIGGRRKSIPGG
jgi:zinc transport system permease protein